MPSITKLFFGLATLSAAAEVCVDTVGWTLVRENRTFGCDHFSNESVCANGMCIETNIGKLCGQEFNFPELNCCACGKATQAAQAAVEVAEDKLQSAAVAAESTVAEAQDVTAAAETAAENAATNAATTAVAATESAVESAKAETASAVASAEDTAASAVEAANTEAASAVEAAKTEASSAVETGAMMAKDAVDAAEKAAEKFTDDISLEKTTLAEQECNCDTDCECGSCDCSDTETAVAVDADVDMIPPATGPSVVLIFGILFAIGSCCSFVAAWHYGLGQGSWACLPCRKRVPCDDGYERIPTTAHLFKDQEGPADYTSWSYGSTQGRMMAA